MVESFFGTLRQELARDTLWPTRKAAREAIADYITKFYNPVRKNSANGLIRPNEHERNHQEAA